MDLRLHEYSKDQRKKRYIVKEPDIGLPLGRLKYRQIPKQTNTYTINLTIELSLGYLYP